MKKFCLIAILVIFNFSVAIAQKIVKNDLYTVVYSEVYCFPNDASVYKKDIESYKVKELSFERDEFEELF